MSEDDVESFSTDENCRENHLMCDDCMAVCLDCNLDANAGGDICKFCSGESIERYDEIGLDAEEGEDPDWDGDPDDFDEQAAWESIFENWMDEWISGDATDDSIVQIYAAINGNADLYDYIKSLGYSNGKKVAEAWYYGLTPTEREDAIFNTTNDPPSGFVHRPAINKAITNIMEDIMSSWDDQFMSESFAANDPWSYRGLLLKPANHSGRSKICDAKGCRKVKKHSRISWGIPYHFCDHHQEEIDALDDRAHRADDTYSAENEGHWKTFGRVDYNWATDPDDLELTDEEFWEIDEHIRNEIRYEIDTNNLPGESEVSSWTLSITPDEGEEFIIYYYWGPAQTTGVNSAEGFEAEGTGGSFVINNNRGFSIGFDNGYALSVKFGPGTYSDNYDMSIYGNVAKARDTATDYIESSTAEIAVLKDGALMSFDAGGGAERTLGWVSTSLIPSLLTAVSEGDDRKIRSHRW